MVVATIGGEPIHDLDSESRAVDFPQIDAAAEAGKEDAAITELPTTSDARLDEGNEATRAPEEVVRRSERRG